MSRNVNLESILQKIRDSVRIQELDLYGSTYGRFEEVLDVLEESYYEQDKLNTGTMLENAIKAYVDSINDPYTVYLDNEANAWLQEELKGEGELEGIGAVVTKKEYYVLIEEVLKQSPAAQAGLMPLDRVVAINGENLKDLDIDQAVEKIRGPKGTSVTLTIERINKNDEKTLLEITVVRDKISIPSVTTEIMTINNKKVAYINISIIGEETEKILKREIPWLKDAGVQWIILDLRGNGGWFLPISVQIASHFIPKDKAIVTAKYKTFPDENYFSFGYNDFNGLPIVVLIDGYTASAGEIIALALKEQIGAVLIWTTTFGKWSIQTLHDFNDGDSLKYTIGKRYSPNNINIDEVGITPDVVVEFDADVYQDTRVDNQLKEAQNIMQKLIK